MPPRTTSFAAGNYYHLYNRGAGRQDIFLETDNYHFVLRKIKKYAAQFEITVIAYCLMPNHYHLLVRQNADTPAGLLPQHVCNSYTKAYNQRYQRSGTLFEGRYEAILIQQESHLLHLCRYIHLNPVKAGLVAHPAAWDYSNYLEWIDQRPGTIIDRHFVQAYFPQPPQYINFVAQSPTPAIQAQLDELLLDLTGQPQ
jgi:REP element-mobilizing transposase RayT